MFINEQEDLKHSNNMSMKGRKTYTLAMASVVDQPVLMMADISRLMINKALERRAATARCICHGRWSYLKAQKCKMKLSYCHTNC